MKIDCPRCHQPISASQLLAEEMRCPACGASFRSGPGEGDTIEAAPRKGELTTDLLADKPAPAAATICPAVAGYEVLGELGRGGMGVVYKARQISLDRLVALKMILAGEHAGAEAVARFRREAESVARLQHPVIVQIHEIGEQGGRPFLSLEYVGGGALAEKLAGKPQPVAVAARLTERLARGMHFAHERGVIHRDLKPANVLLTAPEAASSTGGTAEEATTPWGGPKITDFGLAKRLGAEARHTQSGAIVGTPGYMAPEQARGKVREISPATDVYSLGAILYEILTGRPPFQGDGTLDTVVKLLNEEVVPVTRLRPDCPRDLETICLKCLGKAPAHRYASAAELADDLRRFSRGEPIHARPMSRLERGGRWLKRQRVALSMVALTLVALALGTWFRPAPPLPWAPLTSEEAAKNTLARSQGAGKPPPKGGPGPVALKEPSLPADLALVPRTALAFYSMRWGELERGGGARKLGPLFRPILGPEAHATMDGSWPRLGMAGDNIERATWVVLRPRSLKDFADLEKLLQAGKSELAIYQTIRPYDRAKVLRSLRPNRQTRQHEGRTYHVRADTDPRAVHFAGARLLVDGHPDAVRSLLENMPRPTSPGPLHAPLRLAAEGHLIVVALNPPAGALTQWGDQLKGRGAKLRPHVDALAEARAVALCIDLVPGTTSKGPTLDARLRLDLFFADEPTAGPGRAAAEAMLAQGQQELKESLASVREIANAPSWLLRMVDPRGGTKAVHQVLKAVESSLPKVKVEQKGRTVRGELLVHNAPDHLGALVSLFEFGAHEAYKEHLRKLGKALRAYEKKHGRLPPPAIYSAKGLPLLSWRVLLLPYLGEEKLFKQFRLDQPWDGEHNKRLLDQIPDVYSTAAPFSPVAHGTLFQVVVGPDTLFEGREGVKLEGVSLRTILLVEARRSVPWTKPEDVTYKPDGPLPELGGTFPDGFYVLNADVDERFVRRNIPEKELRRLFTRSGDVKKEPGKAP